VTNQMKNIRSQIHTMNFGKDINYEIMLVK
jgi:hypothetical protein